MIKAVIFDVYGTLIRSKANDLSREPKNRESQIKAMKKLKQKYNFSVSAEKLHEAFFDEIKKELLQKQKEGIDFSEVIIEDIWKKVFESLNLEKVDFVQFALEYHNLCCECSLFLNIKEMSLSLKEKGIHLGIVSNAQFYTKPDLVHLLGIEGMDEIFDKKLVFLSFELGYAKPGQKMFDLLKKELAIKKIKPEETLYIGNDLFEDVVGARKAGFKTGLVVNHNTEYRKDMQLEEPDFKIKDMLEIKKLVG